MRVDEIIEKLGGCVEVAQFLQCAPSAVSMWKERIPSDRALNLAAKAKAMGQPEVTVEVILRATPRLEVQPRRRAFRGRPIARGSIA